MFEAEIKYRTLDAREAGVGEALERIGALGAPPARYVDAYFDAPDGRFGRDGRELRVREIFSGDCGAGRTLLTYKGAPFDAATRSKPEIEVAAGDAGALREMFLGLGFVERVRLVKHCRNARVVFEGAEHLVTLARVEGVRGAFVEIERVCESEAEARAALAAINRLGARLGLGSGDVCPEYYTDLVGGDSGREAATRSG